MLRKILSSHLFFPKIISFAMGKAFLFHLMLEVLLPVVAKFCFLRVALQPLLGSSMDRTVCTRWWLQAEDCSLLNWLFWRNWMFE